MFDFLRRAVLFVERVSPRVGVSNVSRLNDLDLTEQVFIVATRFPITNTVHIVILRACLASRLTLCIASDIVV